MLLEKDENMLDELFGARENKLHVLTLSTSNNFGIWLPASAQNDLLLLMSRSLLFVWRLGCTIDLRGVICNEILSYFALCHPL